MKFLKLLIILIFSTSIRAAAQTNSIDSLKKAIDNYEKDDTVKIKMLYNYAFLMFQSDLEKTKVIIQRGIQLATKINQEESALRGNLYLSYCYNTENENDSSTMVLFNALNISEKYHLDKYLPVIYQSLGEDYRLQGKYKNSEFYDGKFLDAANLQKDSAMILQAQASFVFLYQEEGQTAKSYRILDRALPLAIVQKNEYIMGRLYQAKGSEYLDLKNLEQALSNYQIALKIWEKENDHAGVAYTLYEISKAFLIIKNKDSTAWYAYAALDTAKKYHLKKETGDAYEVLVDFHSHFGDYKKALEEKIISDSIQNELANPQTAQTTLKAEIKYEQEKKDLLASIEQTKKEAVARRAKNWTYGIITAFILLAAFLLFNNRQKQKSKIKIEKAYSELKSTQALLIQSEKMASLGELTAGIAHEIQNPLNFVNNFSEVNTELLEEASAVIQTGKSEEAMELMNMLIENEKKINHHGKRADAIVKGMLEHSRSGTGIKVPTDVNAMADEYLKLSYHGLRARNSSLNATTETNFDPAIGSVQIVPQDIGRVLLNLYNNAFYAVAEKIKGEGAEYQPTVSVRTKKTGNTISIIVKDNGNGIPKKLIDKIFQPFFTTKPTGQGTGLGLSLSYDIVKAHGGDIKVNTSEGNFTEFLIQLPA